MQKFKVGAVILALGVGFVLSLKAAKLLAHRPETPALLPLPQKIQTQKGYFPIQSSTGLEIDRTSEPAGQLLAERLRTSTGFDIPLREQAHGLGQSGMITLTTESAKSGLGPEGYELSVTAERVVIRASSSAGFTYGAQSLLQLMSPEVFSPRLLKGREWKIACASIEDQPRFAWRGMMLDVSRHFFNPNEIKQLLDAMVLHKLNTFHWHLTDDQGWRIEIKKYPRLTEVGAWRKRIGFDLDPKTSSAFDKQGHYGGYYTQAEIRDIVAYAKNRSITIVPEIDIPGHSSAALAAYPQFSCSGGPYTTDMSEARLAGVFCASNDATYEFLQDILSEVMALFPGEFLHVGGDEVTKQNWHNCVRCQALITKEGLGNERGLQDYFIKRIQAFVNAHGKRVIGWSEIRNANLAQSTAIMDWIGGGKEAALAGHDVVMCPEEYCYLDFYQSRDRANEPPAAGAYLPLQKVYSFEPVPEGLGPPQNAHTLGAQGNIWTEYMASLAQVEYMAFPRMSALAEVVWSPKQKRDWPDFVRRVAVDEQRLTQLGIKYRVANPVIGD